MSIHLPTTALDSRFPLSISTLYNYRSTGRVDWLSKRGRFLWLDVPRFNSWAAGKGKQFRLDPEHPMAVELGEEGGAR